MGQVSGTVVLTEEQLQKIVAEYLSEKLFSPDVRVTDIEAQSGVYKVTYAAEVDG